jgi:hypothetical protein
MDSLYDVLQEFSDSVPPHPDDAVKLFILSNRYRTYGASVLLYPGLLSALSNQFESDLIVLPSSVHEVLFLPVSGPEDFANYSDMVKEVNECAVSDVEILSDHAYYFSRRLQQLQLSPSDAF